MTTARFWDGKEAPEKTRTPGFRERPEKPPASTTPARSNFRPKNNRCVPGNFTRGSQADEEFRRTAAYPSRLTAMAEPSVIIAPGKQPAAVPHSTVFFANLGSMFFGNTEATRALRSLLGGTLDSYGGRLASCLDLLYHSTHDHPNLLVTTMPLQADLAGYHSGILGLKLPGVAVADPDHYETPELLARIRKTPSTHLDGFVTDAQLERIAAETGKQTHSPSEGSYLANNKLAFHREVERLGLPTFATEVAESQDDLARCYQTLSRQGYRFAAVKSQVGASGIGVQKIDTRNPDPIPGLIFHDGACLVQGWIEPGIKAVKHIHSPSVQVLVGEKEITLFDTTDQILDHQSVHEGNLAPPQHPEALTEEQNELLAQSKAIVPWLHRTGYRGPASIDFHVARHGEVSDVRACEINARVTGATYPSLLARKFQKNGAWLLRNLALPEPLPALSILSILDDQNALYRPGQENGCLPINFNMTKNGEISKGQFLFLGPDVYHASEQLAELVSLPEINLHYDRD